MQRLVRSLLLTTSVIGCIGCGGSSNGSGDPSASSPCDRWKDAALRYASCNPALVVSPSRTQACVSDQEVALRGPLPTLAACADNLAGLTHNCRALDVLREAYRSDNETVFFDYIQKTGIRPGCDCDPIDERFLARPTQFEPEGRYQCAALLIEPDSGISD
jgi:hypothetical protein